MSTIQPASKSQVQPKKAKIVSSYKHKQPLVSCRFHPNGKFVFFGSQDQKIYRWDTSKKTVVELKGHDSWTRGLAFNAKGDQLVSAGYDGRLIWWSALDEKPKIIRTIQAHDGWARSVAFSPDGKLIASCGNDLKVNLWTRDGKLVRSLEGHKSHVYNCAFHPKEARLVTGDLKAELNDWNIETGKLVRSFKAASLHKYDTGFKADIGGPRGMCFHRSGSLLACSGIANVTNAFAGVGNPSFEVIDWKTGKRKIQHVSKAKLRGVGWGVELHPYDFTIGISGGGGGGYLLFWKPTEQHEFHQLKLPNTARDLSLSPDLIHLAIAHHDGNVRLVKMG